MKNKHVPGTIFLTRAILNEIHLLCGRIHEFDIYCFSHAIMQFQQKRADEQDREVLTQGYKEMIPYPL